MGKRRQKVIVRKHLSVVVKREDFFLVFADKGNLVEDIPRNFHTGNLLHRHRFCLFKRLTPNKGFALQTKLILFENPKP